MKLNILLKKGCAMGERFLKVFIVIGFISLVGGRFGHASGSGGVRIYGADSEAMGKAGAFVAEADNASAVYYNPAGLTQLKESQASFSLPWLNVFVDHTNASGVETQMRRTSVPLPSMYYTHNFGLDRMNFGVGARPNYGAGTDWAPDSFSGYVATKTDMENLDYLITGAMQVTDNLSFGIGFDVVDAKLSQNKNLNQLPGSDAQAQLKFSDVAWSYSLSTLYKFNEQHQIGLQYKSQPDMKLEGKTYLHGLSDAGATPLATIFGGSTYSTDVEWDVDLPQSLVLGYSYQPNDQWRVNLDVEWTDWSVIEQEVINFPSESDATRLTVLDAATRLPLDWHGSFAYSLGTEYQYNEQTRLRAGYFFHESPIPEENFNTFLPDSQSHGVSLGFGYDINDSMVLDLAWNGVFFKDRKIDNAVGASSGASIDGTYEEYMNIAYAGFTYKFSSFGREKEKLVKVSGLNEGE